MLAILILSIKMSVDKILKLIAYIHTPKSIKQKCGDVGFIIQLGNRSICLCYDYTTGTIAKLNRGLHIQKSWDKVKFEISRFGNPGWYDYVNYDIAESLNRYTVTENQIQYKLNDKVTYPTSKNNNLFLTTWDYYKLVENRFGYDLFDNITTISHCLATLEKQYDTIQRRLLVLRMGFPKELAEIIGYNIYLLY